MNPSVVLGQAVVVGLLVTALRAYGHAWESIVFAAAPIVFAYLIVLCSSPARRGLPVDARRYATGRIIGSVIAILAPQLALDVLGLVGFVDLGGDHHAVLAMTLIAVVVAEIIYLSSVIDWFYVRSHLLGSGGMVCCTSTGDPWRLVTRVRLAHRLAAVLGFIAGVTALVALAANQWIRPLDETAAGAIGGVAAVGAGYYLARAAPLVALATNPSVLICDVVSLAEEFNVPDNQHWRRYLVLDIGWEGVKLRDVTSWQSGTSLGQHIPPEPAASANAKPPPHDRMLDVADTSKLLRGRQPLRTCHGPCHRWTGGCLATTRTRGTKPAPAQGVASSA